MRRGNADNLLALEVGAPEKVAVAIAATGATVENYWSGRRGMFAVVLRSAKGYLFEYSNLSRVWVEIGQTVGCGEPVGVAGASFLWYEVQTGQRYFAVIGMESRPVDTGYPWVLEIGSGISVTTRDLRSPALTLEPSVEDYWFPSEVTHPAGQ